AEWLSARGGSGLGYAGRSGNEVPIQPCLRGPCGCRRLANRPRLRGAACLIGRGELDRQARLSPIHAQPLAQVARSAHLDLDRRVGDLQNDRGWSQVTITEEGVRGDRRD